MTILEERIEFACKKVGISWYPFFMQDGKAVFPSTINTPAVIQDVNDKWEWLQNGNIKRTIDFYIFDKRKKEMSPTNIKDDVIVKHNNLTNLILQLINELSKTEFKVYLVGQPYKSQDNMKILDIGQDFTLTIEYAPCQV